MSTVHALDWVNADRLCCVLGRTTTRCSKVRTTADNSRDVRPNAISGSEDHRCEVKWDLRAGEGCGDLKRRTWTGGRRVKKEVRRAADGIMRTMQQVEVFDLSRGHDLGIADSCWLSPRVAQLAATLQPDRTDSHGKPPF